MRGYLPYHFLDREFGAKIQKQPRDSKIERENLKKWAAADGGNVCFGEGSFYLVLVRSNRGGGRG